LAGEVKLSMESLGMPHHAMGTGHHAVGTGHRRERELEVATR
jgi:hypothetical protein